MFHSNARTLRPLVSSGQKTCPWCGGALGYTAHYPVMHLAPGDVLVVSDKDVPQGLRTVPAWTCQTPLCRYRESA